MDAGAVAEAYFTAWENRDLDTLGGVLAEDVTFQGPLATVSGREDCLAGLAGMAQLLERIEVLHRWVDGPDVATWFVLHAAGAEPAPTVNWSHVEDGRITAIRVTFDPRGIIAAREQAGA